MSTAAIFEDVGSAAMAQGEDEPREIHLNINIPEQQQGGVWANFARVNHSVHEFTIDFVRIDFGHMSDDDEAQGIVVARVGVSPLFVRQLITALEENWKKYAKKALPREVYADDDSEQSNS
jgi:hypothetical protein